MNPNGRRYQYWVGLDEYRDHQPGMELVLTLGECGEGIHHNQPLVIPNPNNARIKCMRHQDQLNAYSCKYRTEVIAIDWTHNGKRVSAI